MKKCRSCKYFESKVGWFDYGLDRKEFWHGFCHLNPPQPKLIKQKYDTNAKIFWGFPAVKHSDWCKSYENKVPFILIGLFVSLGTIIGLLWLILLAI